ncbi:MAG TPA: lysylphosphatidylglycerol synthase transmembrane domain-containing protein [Bacteroidota bacterium]|nr:lysylphosphatidylglycerol synthase transmembrane domain-containing protein [Bacteroidota bacterium]
MQPRLKKYLQTGAGFLLAVAFLYLAFRGVSFKELWASLQDVDYFWVGVLVPIVVVSHWLRAVRWRYFLDPVKEHISVRNLFSGVMIGFMVNNLLPRVGEVTRAVAVGRSEKISTSSVFGTVVIERIVDMATFLFILCAVLFIYPSSLDPFVDNAHAVRPFFFVGGIGFLLFFVFLFFKAASLFRLLEYLKRFVPRGFEVKYQSILDSFLSGFGVAKMRSKYGMIALLSVLIYTSYAMSLYVPFFAFHTMAGHNLDIGASFILLTISTIAFAFPAPGALGTYHQFLSFALVRLYGVDTLTALSFAIITHEVGYIITTAVGLYYFFKDHLRMSEVVNATTDN